MYTLGVPGAAGFWRCGCGTKKVVDLGWEVQQGERPRPQM